MNQALPPRAKFHHMKDGTQEDWSIIGADPLLTNRHPGP